LLELQTRVDTFGAEVVLFAARKSFVEGPTADLSKDGVFKYFVGVHNFPNVFTHY